MGLIIIICNYFLILHILLVLIYCNVAMGKIYYMHNLQVFCKVWDLIFLLHCRSLQRPQSNELHVGYISVTIQQYLVTNS
jgi:hypothetical protein